MKLKNNPIRTCMGCNKESEKLELLKLLGQQTEKLSLIFQVN